MACISGISGNFRVGYKATTCGDRFWATANVFGVRH